MAVEYLTQAIRDVAATPTPRYGMAADGYTLRSGAPTGWLIRLAGEHPARWRRVMVWQFSNAGTLFVRVKGAPLVIPEHVLAEARCEKFGHTMMPPESA